MISLSPSGINLMDECPRCFWNEYHGKPRPRMIFPSITNGIDREMKNLFDQRRATQSYDCATIIPGDYFIEPDQILVDKLRARNGGLWWQEGDYRMHGLLDDLLAMHDGKKVIIDFKSKGSVPQQDDTKWYVAQMSMYAFLMNHNGYKVHNKAVLLYIFPAMSDANSITMSTASLEIDVSPEQGARLLNRAIALLSADMPESSVGCTYCAYRVK